MQAEQLDIPAAKFYTFIRSAASNVHCSLGSAKCLDAGLNYEGAIGFYSQAFRHFVSCFRQVAKNIKPHSYNTQNEVFTSNDCPYGKRSYEFTAFDSCRQRELSSAQILKRQS